jgi:hypothetical protein
MKILKNQEKVEVKVKAERNIKNLINKINKSKNTPKVGADQTQINLKEKIKVPSNRTIKNLRALL